MFGFFVIHISYIRVSDILDTWKMHKLVVKLFITSLPCLRGKVPGFVSECSRHFSIMSPTGKSQHTVLYTVFRSLLVRLLMTSTKYMDKSYFLSSTL